jgi:phosphohistidine phosphatase
VIRLTLVRHARAEAKPAGGTDFDRHLDRRGLVEAADLAHRLLAAGLVPDLLVASPAPRALVTAQIVAREMHLAATRVEEDAALYLAEPELLLERIGRLPDDATHAMIVAHNPGITELARQLADDVTLPELPTAGACSVVLDIPRWDAVTAAAPIEVYLEPARGASG